MKRHLSDAAPGHSPRRDARVALEQALVHLLTQRRIGAIRVSDVVAEAGLARSTFYEHFASKDQALLAVAAPVLTQLANVASGRAGLAPGRMLAEHLWAVRTPMRHILAAPVARQLERALAEQIAQRWERESIRPGQPQLLAQAIAAGQLAIIRAWLGGEHSASSAELAETLIALSPQQVRLCPA